MFKIITPQLEVYTVNEKGQIGRTDMPFTPSDTWKLLGIEHVKQRWFIPFNELTEDKVKTLPLLYKNGNPQFTIRDLDHGTARTWGNTKYHGIAKIEFNPPW
jgi:hypothetical protein